MDYASILKVVKAQYKDMPYKEAQKKASELHKKFLAAEGELKDSDILPKGTTTSTEAKKEIATEPKTGLTAKTKDQGTAATSSTASKTSGKSIEEKSADKTESPKDLSGNVISIDALRDVEQHIRDIGVNKNNICLFGNKLLIDGELIKHGRVGVNTEVSFEDPVGNKIPVDGYFLIWL